MRRPATTGLSPLRRVRAALRRVARRRYAAALQRYFKTGPGQYGEGDVFLGVRVPALRKLAREHAALGLADARRLLASPVHEERMLALLVLARLYERGKEAARAGIYRLYLDSTRRVNNWDLVDLSAPRIVGAHLLARDRRPLLGLARSRNLWRRRIAIVATASFIARGEFGDTLAVAGILLDDPEDLIHKATGWMLREVGKRDRGALERFLGRHCRRMPRTMLRYALEKFPAAERRKYMAAAAPRGARRQGG